MKKFLAVFALATVVAACNNTVEEVTVEETMVDTTAVDTTVVAEGEEASAE